MSLTWTRVDGARIALRGAIDEKSVFDELLAEMKDGTTLDMAGVERINSVGVRNWMEFVSKLLGRSVTLSACSVPVVHQLNIIARFAGDARVSSVQAPFLCPECETSTTATLDLARDVEPQLREPVSCPKCGAAAEFDDVPASYLAFLRKR